MNSPLAIMLLYLALFVSYSLLTHSLRNNSTFTCLSHQSLALLRFHREFSLKNRNFTHSHYSHSYDSEESVNCFPKTKSWKEGKDCCEWEGVSCDIKTGYVISLDLSHSCLNGPLLSNSSLFHLHQIRRLNLAFNNFSLSKIPSTFGVLSRLTHLNLSFSLFSGNIPLQLLPFTHLISLDLSSHRVWDENSYLYRGLVNLQLKELPKSMKNIKFLHLNGVDLSSLKPQTFANLSSLTSLSVRECSLSGEFPKNVFELPEIQFIDLSWNLLNGSLPTFYSSNKLKFLLLHGCRFYGSIPSSIGNLSSLIELHLSNNQLDGQIPSTIGDLFRLQRLIIGYNLEGILPSSLGNLSQLSELSLEGNFRGQIPKTLGNLAKLQSFGLTWYSNRMELPSSLGNLSKLSELNLQGNFVGELPQTLGNLVKLESLYVSNYGEDGLTGELPSSMGNLKQLKYLTITGNKFSSQIPCSFRNLSLLTDIDLSYNNLNGMLPSYLFSMPSLVYLQLNLNKLSGPLSLQNVSTYELSIMNLAENKLTGQIPTTISKLKNMESIDLSSNNFSGQVELDIFSGLSELVDLDLSGNSLSVKQTDSNITFPKFDNLELSSCNIHKFPDFLKIQDRLRTLDLSNNKLEGTIPKWFNSIGVETLDFLDISHNSITGWEQSPFILPWKILDVLDMHSNAIQGPLAIPPISLQYLLMSENQLSGIIPQSFCNLTDLEVLDVSKNNLSGNIPQCLGGFSSNLVVLSLQGNNFNGTIPHTFLENSGLMTIDLSHNKLEGKVPQSLINCTSLEVLNLGNNQISDRFPFWLQNMPELQVLVLRYNKFQGPIWDSHKFLGFEKLRIVDLSFNMFSGSLPLNYFKNWTAMSVTTYTTEQQSNYMMADGYYKDSLTVMNKGIEMEFVRILTIFTSIDLSNNNFFGEIPISIGDLQGLIVLNLSANSFEGLIPSSFGKLKNMESLDLSNNKLFGRIPQELASLSFLEYLNLSQNQLSGLIPQGRHFDTFPNSSFEGNSGLCGFPLSKECQMIADNETPIDESESENGFGWKPVVIGYGFGFLIGAVGGYMLFTKKPNLFIKIYGREKKRRQ